MLNNALECGENLYFWLSRALIAELSSPQKRAGLAEKKTVKTRTCIMFTQYKQVT